MAKKLTIFIVIFIIISAFVHSIDSHTDSNKMSIKNCINNIEGFKVRNSIQLSPDHFDMIKLDDYLFLDFEGPNGIINLYVGYYYSSSKAYAAHSPLICYPSQGWEINEDPKKNSLRLGSHSIHYIETAASSGNKRELIFFWYQSYLKTNYTIYQNKIDMGYNKLMHNGEEHAFVRISTSYNDENYKEKKDYLLSFLFRFYPQFVTFITNCE